MERRAWKRICFTLFPVSFCLLVGLTLHVAKSAAASTAAQSGVEEGSIDASDRADQPEVRQAPQAASNEEGQPQEDPVHLLEAAFAVPREEGVDLSGGLHEDHQPEPSSAASVVRNIISAILTVTIVFLSVRIVWDVMNFVGDVPDPFADVRSADEIPQAIDELLNANVPLAFVIRKCKLCGLGIREMKAHGLEPVVVMIEGHRFQQAIRHHLRSRYHVRGLPYFFLNKDEHGYLTAVKAYLRNEH